MFRHRTLIAAAALAALSILPAYSQTTVLDQVPVPIPATTTGVGQSEFLLQSLSTGGITCYMAFYKPPGAPSQPFVQPGGLSCPQSQNSFSAITGTATPFPITGLAAAQGGTIQLTGGTSSTSGNAGGPAQVIGGVPGATGVGGAASVTGGAGGATSGNGGVGSVVGGAGTNGNGVGGQAQVTGGAGQGTGNGGAVVATGGASGAGATGAGGAISATGGAAASTNGAGGAASLVGGLGAGTGNGGAIAVTGGGSGSGATGAGGALVAAGGAANSTNGAGGAVSLTGGAGVGTGNGGAASLVGGAAGATGTGGAVAITAGSPTAGNGSAVTITASAGAGGTNAGGTVNVVPGAAVSTGAPGQFQVNGDGGIICPTFYYTPANAPTVVTTTFFIATRPMYIVEASEIHSVAAGGAATMGVFHDTSTNAPGAGTDVMATDFNLNGTANTVQNTGLTTTVATKTLAAGDRLAVKWVTGAIQSSAGIVVTVCMTPQ
jgi:hypothetical protein